MECSNNKTLTNSTFDKECNASETPTCSISGYEDTQGETRIVDIRDKKNENASWNKKPKEKPPIQKKIHSFKLEKLDSK